MSRGGRPDCSVLVCGLPASTDDAGLRQLFAFCGPIAGTLVDDEDSSTQRSGLVQFRSPEGAAKAIAAMRGCNFHGASITVKMAGYVEPPPGDAATQQAFRSGARVRVGSGRSVGTVLAWKGMYGWIKADSKVMHPAAVKHDGQVFVNLTDLDGMVDLQPGERVSFNVYADAEGLGASEVRLYTGQGLGMSFEGGAAARPQAGGTEANVAGWPPTLRDSFKKTFERFGPLLSSRVERPQAGESRTSGLLIFASLQAARAAVDAMDGKLYGGKPLRVWIDGDDREADAEAFEAQDLPGDSPLPEGRVTGVVRSWKGKYGWITADARIAHREMAKHNSFIYVDAKDLQGGRTELPVGARVSFGLYTDKQGVGASQVSVEGDGHEASSGSGAPATGTPRWWHALAGDCCPISLTEMEELEHEPFGLVGSVEGAAAVDGDGLFGEAGRAAAASSGAVHWFDGKHLACTLVSTRQLLDPLSMRPLSRRESASLDRYLSANRLPAVRVAEVFDLTRLLAAAQPEAVREASDRRLAALAAEAASFLRLFDEAPDQWQALAAASQEAFAADGGLAQGDASGYPSAVGGAAASAAVAAGTDAGAAGAAAGVVRKARRWGREK